MFVILNMEMESIGEEKQKKYASECMINNKLGCHKYLISYQIYN